MKKQNDSIESQSDKVKWIELDSIPVYDIATTYVDISSFTDQVELIEERDKKAEKRFKKWNWIRGRKRGGYR